MPVRPVYVDVVRPAHGNLARTLVEGDSFELLLLVNVRGLEDMVRRVEDDEGVAGYVGLAGSAFARCPEVWAGYNDLLALPKAVSDSLQLRLRPSGEDVAHVFGGLRLLPV